MKQSPPWWAPGLMCLIVVSLILCALLSGPALPAEPCQKIAVRLGGQAIVYACEPRASEIRAWFYSGAPAERYEDMPPWQRDMEDARYFVAKAYTRSGDGAASDAATVAEVERGRRVLQERRGIRPGHPLYWEPIR